MGSIISMQGSWDCMRNLVKHVREASQEAVFIHRYCLKILLWVPDLGSFHDGL